MPARRHGPLALRPQCQCGRAANMGWRMMQQQADQRVPPRASLTRVFSPPVAPRQRFCTARSNSARGLGAATSTYNPAMAHNPSMAKHRTDVDRPKSLLEPAHITSGGFPPKLPYLHKENKKGLWPLPDLHRKVKAQRILQASRFLRYHCR